MPVAKPKAIDWARVRADYEGGEGTVVAIAKRHRVSRARIQRVARKQGWARRFPERCAPAVALPSDVPPAYSGQTNRVARKEMIRQLYRLVAHNLKRMETGMTTDDPASPIDKERETRAIGKLIQNVERVTELETDRNRGAPSSTGADARGEPGPLTPEETQRLSLELAERLHKLARRSRAERDQ